MSDYTSFERGNPEYTTGRKKYPNPFFDLASWNLPKNIKTLFKYCRGFFYTNGFIRNIISKLTEYSCYATIYCDNGLGNGLKINNMETFNNEF